MSTFSRFHPLLQSQIVGRLGWTSLRPVQEMAGKAILDGKNCVVLAPTAGGKTEASFFPVLSQILDQTRGGIKAIYLSPIKALINNLEPRIEEYCSMINLSVFKWHGDTDQNQRKRFLAEPTDVLLTTPESLEVMLISPKVSTSIFQSLQFIIIDEIHAFASVDRGIHLLSVMERIKYLHKKDFQRIGLSATIGNPLQLLDWLQGSSNNEKELVDPPILPSKKLIEISYEEDPVLLKSAISSKVRNSKSLIFCESRKLAEEMGKYFHRMEMEAFVHHSSLSITSRALAEKEFSESQVATIISTSTMELGIDVGDLDHVLQIEAPASVASFLQRLGRTGRRENSVANTSFFVSKDSYLLLAIALVELTKKKKVESIRFKSKSYHILIHQIMAMCLQWGGVNRNTLWENLHSVYSFAGIEREEFTQFIDDLIQSGYLFLDNGFISMGEKAESSFGRKNFLEMYSVLSSILEFSVLLLNGVEIGKIQQDFAESLFPGLSSFLLAGKAWLVERIDWNQSKIFVSNAPAGKTPQWSTLMPRFLSYDLCREMKEILESKEEYSYLKESAKEKLKNMRNDTGEFLRSSFAPLEIGEEGFTWWTYAGGKINNTLKIVFKIEGCNTVISSNEWVRIEKKGFTLEDFTSILSKMKGSDYFSEARFLDALIAHVPNYRLSKFQSCLPEAYQKFLIAQEVLDVENTVEFMKRVSG